MMHPPRLPQVWHRRAGRPEQRVQVGAEHPVEALVVDGVDALTASHLEAGVVDQDVETTEHLDRLQHDPVARFPLAEVGLVRHALATGGLDQLDRLLGIRLLLGHEGEGDVGTLAGERDRHRAADAGVATGDERPLALEAAVALVGVLAVVGPRLHLVGEAGRFLLLRREGLVGHDASSSGVGHRHLRGVVTLRREPRLVLGLVLRVRRLGRFRLVRCRGCVGCGRHRRPPSSCRIPGRIVSFQPLLDQHPASHRLSGDATGRDGG